MDFQKDISYVVSFHHKYDKGIDLPLLYFDSPQLSCVSYHHKITRSKNSITSLPTQSNFDRLLMIHNVLESVKKYYDNNWIVRIEHLHNNDIKHNSKSYIYSEYTLHNDDWTFLDNGSNSYLNILNLPFIKI